MNRRYFIITFSLFSAGLSAANFLLSGFFGASPSPSDRINVALIGCNSKDFNFLKNHLAYNNIIFFALCDVDKNILDKRAAEIREKYDQDPDLYIDYRKMLKQKNIHAVIIGTPDHWHCLQMVDAVQAGKDVYVEKLMANTSEECNLMVRGKLL